MNAMSQKVIGFALSGVLLTFRLLSPAARELLGEGVRADTRGFWPSLETSFWRRPSRRTPSCACDTGNSASDEA